MIFFDPNNPNKYKKVKKLLVPRSIFNFRFKRIGENDGSYVLPESISDNLAVLSYGIGDDPMGVSFEQEIDKNLNNYLQMYDGSIDEVPVKLSDRALFFKEFLTPENFINHFKLFQKNRTQKYSVLKMDIEGCEYNWLNDVNYYLLNTFDVFCVEVHGLIEERPQGWVFPEAMEEVKKDGEKVLSFLKRIKENFVLFHMHGNNHSPRYVDLPDSLELTYVHKRNIYKNTVRKEKFPVDILDKPNYNAADDYVLDWWF